MPAEYVARGGEREMMVGEQIQWSADFTSAGLSSIASGSVVVEDITTGTPVNVTSTVMPTGTATASGAVITAPVMSGQVAGKRYRLTFQPTSGTQRPKVLLYVVVSE